VQLSYGGERERFGADYDDIVPSVNAPVVNSRKQVEPEWNHGLKPSSAP
jgi:hypothetical protein